MSFWQKSTKTDSYYSSSETLSSRSSEVTVMAEEPGGGPATSTTTSTMTKGVSNPQSSIAAAAMLGREMPEPSTTEGRRIRGEL